MRRSGQGPQDPSQKKEGQRPKNSKQTEGQESKNSMERQWCQENRKMQLQEEQRHFEGSVELTGSELGGIGQVGSGTTGGPESLHSHE